MGQLEAYNAAGELLERVTTAPLSVGQIATLTIIRPAVDIAYVIAAGHRNTSVKLDNLQFGPQAWTTTGPLGTYNLAALPAGTYWIQATALGGNPPLDPLAARRQATVATGVATRDVDFGFATAAYHWHNQSNPVDVNNDGLITPIDALLVINEINLRGARSLVGSNLDSPPYIDTNSDNLVTGNDVLQVINYINAHPSRAGAPGEGEQSHPEAEIASVRWLAGADGRRRRSLGTVVCAILNIKLDQGETFF